MRDHGIYILGRLCFTYYYVFLLSLWRFNSTSLMLLRIISLLNGFCKYLISSPQIKIDLKRNEHWLIYGIIIGAHFPYSVDSSACVFGIYLVELSDREFFMLFYVSGYHNFMYLPAERSYHNPSPTEHLLTLSADLESASHCLTHSCTPTC